MSESAVLFLLTLAFQAGGFIWLTQNHMKHAQQSLDRLEERMQAMESLVNRICGKLGIEP